MNKALIYKIDRLNTHNGAGFRTVIYFKGCPLHCTWCHNPEGISSKPEIWISNVKCLHCHECTKHCPSNALTYTSEGIHVSRDRCTGCHNCTSACPSKAIEPIGHYYSVEELMRVIKQDQFLFASSGGGITVTGGEPGLYADFIYELFSACKAEGIHTACDTSGMIATKALDKILECSQQIFLDIKLYNQKDSTFYTGAKLDVLKKHCDHIINYHKKHNTQLEIRTPLVPSITDTEENLRNIALWLQSYEVDIIWEWCLFNDLCEDKYKRLDMKWPHKGDVHKVLDYQQFQELAKKLTPLNIIITGFHEP